MNKNSFSKKDIGVHVVFAGFDGGSYSATITDYRPAGLITNRTEAVVVQYFPCGIEPVRSILEKKDWTRLTRFGAASFLVIA